MLPSDVSSRSERERDLAYFRGQGLDDTNAHLLVRGLRLQEKGQANQALDYFQTVLRNYPDCTEARINIEMISRRRWANLPSWVAILFGPTPLVVLLSIVCTFQFPPVLPSIPHISDQDFADLWRSLSPHEQYQLMLHVPKGGDIHNHLSGTGDPQWWLDFGSNETITDGETFYTRYKLMSRPDSILWQTIAECTLIKLPQHEQIEFKALHNLKPEEKAKWLEAVLVAGKRNPRGYFYSSSFSVLGELSDNIYIRMEVLVKYMRQLQDERALYLETMNGLKYRTRCSQLSEDDAVVYIEKRLSQADAMATGVQTYFQFYVPRTHPDAHARIRDVVKRLESNQFSPRWVAGNIVGPEQNDRGCLDLLISRQIEHILGSCLNCKWSVHAGELRCANRNVLEALTMFNATRIGHGLNWLTWSVGASQNITNQTLEYLLTRGVLIETNLISNFELGILSNFSEHPLPQLLRLRIPTCLNTDDSAM